MRRCFSETRDAVQEIPIIHGITVMSLSRWLLKLFSFLLIVTTAIADTFTLSNGDRLTGRILSFSEGELVINTELIDVVRIDWDDIQAIDGQASLLVQTRQGLRVIGQLSRNESEIVIKRDGPDVEIDSESIVRIIPATSVKRPWKIFTALDGAVDYGYSFARGNQNQTQSLLGVIAEYRSVNYKLSGRLDSLFARQDDAHSQSRHALISRVDRYINSNFLVYGLTELERNERRNLDLRTQVGGGIGWQVTESNKNDLVVLGGFSYADERYREDVLRKTVESRVGIEWGSNLFNLVELTTQFSVHPDHRESGRVRLQYDSTIRIPIFKRITYSLRLFDRYDSRPVTSVKRNDYGLASGLGITF